MLELLIVISIFIWFIIFLIVKFHINNKDKPTILELILMFFLTLPLIGSFLILW